MTEEFYSILHTIEPDLLTQFTAKTQAWPSTGYIAPELWDPNTVRSGCHTLNQNTDVFAFGSLCYEVRVYIYTSFMVSKHYLQLLAGDPPFRDLSIKRTMQEITEGNRPPPVGWLSSHKDVWKLIEGCWNHTPSNRPSFHDIAECLQRFVDTEPS